MMLFKLALGNVKKSFRDYAVYFLTLVFAVCIFYMFNSLDAQQELMQVTKTKNQSMVALTEIMGVMSVFVSVVLGFLIVYANNFLIKRRKKELGIYMTLGMEKRKISTILMLETLFIGVFALVVGLISGVFGSQLMSIFTAKMFEMDMTAFKFIFSPAATIKAISYFGLIFLVVMVFNVISISRCKLINLLYAENKNESFKSKNITVSAILFVLSIISLGISYYLIITNGMLDLNIYFTLSLIFGTIGTILFFRSLSGFLIKFVQSNKRVYFNGLNIFLLRQLNSKINTNYISMSIICITLLFTIGTLSSGVSLSDTISKSIKNSTPFDNSILIFGDEDNEPPDIYSEINELYNLEGKFRVYETHHIYISEKTYDDVLPKEYMDGDYSKFDIDEMRVEVISLSDFNKILGLYGEKPISLTKDQYAINASYGDMKIIFEKFMDDENTINISENTFMPKEGMIFDKSLKNDMIIFGVPVVIINDEFTSKLLLKESILNIFYNETIDPEIFDVGLAEAVKQERLDKGKKALFFLSYSKNAIYEGSVSTKTIVTFIAIYLGFVFLVTCVAVLALQQLSDAADNKKRYDLLRKMGAEKSMIKKTLFTQILIYFLMPLGLAIVHSIVGLSVVNDIIKAFGKLDVWNSILITTGIFVTIYGGYFVATYIGCKNIILKD